MAMTETGRGLDQEWMALILEAKKMGLSKEMVSEFLNNQIQGELKQA